MLQTPRWKMCAWWSVLVRHTVIENNTFICRFQQFHHIQMRTLRQLKSIRQFALDETPVKADVVQPEPVFTVHLQRKNHRTTRRNHVPAEIQTMYDDIIHQVVKKAERVHQ